MHVLLFDLAYCRSHGDGTGASWVVVGAFPRKTGPYGGLRENNYNKFVPQERLLGKFKFRLCTGVCRLPRVLGTFVFVEHYYRLGELFTAVFHIVVPGLQVAAQTGVIEST